MADPTPTPVLDWKQKYGATIFHLFMLVVTAIISAVATWLGVPPTVVIQTQEVRVAETEPADATDHHSFGWVADQDQIAANLDPAKTLQFKQTPAGRAALGDENVFLWPAVRKVNNKGPPWYPNIDQGSVGCCVGGAYKHGADVCQATQITNGTPATWKPVSVETIYAGSRVDVGRGQLRGDGSVGAWAAEYIRTVGVAPMEKIGDYDLTTFSPARAREWGSRGNGVPSAVTAVAKQHPVKGTALVTTWEDVKRSVMQGYPVAVCSNQGFNNRDGSVGTRDRDGFCSPRGTWAHAMCIIGVRGGNRPGGFILNSWGDSAHRGPVWPADAPVAGFWAESTVIERMVREGDSFALSSFTGFPARKPLDWAARPMPRRDLFARQLPGGLRCDLFCLAP